MEEEEMEMKQKKPKPSDFDRITEIRMLRKDIYQRAGHKFLEIPPSGRMILNFCEQELIRVQAEGFLDKIARESSGEE